MITKTSKLLQADIEKKAEEICSPPILRASLYLFFFFLFWMTEVIYNVKQRPWATFWPQ